MALSGNSSRGTADPVDLEYLNYEVEGAPAGIHMHVDAVDGIARDVMEGFKALPRRGVEVGGLLLGKVIGSESPDVWIERYQRIECEHRFGPQFALDAQDHSELERAAQRIAESTELAVVGLYRSHTRPGFQLEESDLALIGRYFSDPADLVLLIRPENSREISARFYARDFSGAMQPVGEPFAFRGRVLGPADSMPAGEEEEADAAEVTRATESTRQTDHVRSPAAENPASAQPDADPPPPSEEGAEVPARDAASPAPPREKVRRLVPDFAPAPLSLEEAKEPVEPGGVFSFDGRSRLDAPQFTLEPEIPGWRQVAMRWWPLAGAIALVCAALWILLAQSPHGAPADTAANVAGEYRPVGMYVDPGAQRWRVSWNPSATAFSNARSVALFVRDGDAEDRVDLTRQDVQQGTYSWQPKGGDVTFRLEAIDGAGHISAESFRVIRSVASSNAAPAATAANSPAAHSTLPASAPPAPTAATPKPQSPAAHPVPAKAVHKVPPVVPASIRPRIRGVIPIDVRVHIDARGRVVSATLVSKAAPGLNSYLASRAVYAARLWRFTPARENGRAAASKQTIHFVFEK